MEELHGTQAQRVILPPGPVALVLNFIGKESRLALRQASRSWRRSVDKATAMRDKLKDKFADHFPDAAKRIAERDNQKINWTREFIANEMMAYKEFNKKIISLFRAVKNKDMDALRAIEGITPTDLYVKENTAQKMTALDYCILNGFQEGANFLFENANRHNSVNMPKLNLAICANQPLEVIKDYYNRCIQEDQITFEPSINMTFFCLACKVGNLGAVKYFLDNKVIEGSLLKKDPYFINEICQMRHPALLREFLKRKILNLNQQISPGKSLLFFALTAGNSELVELLLEQGANPVNVHKLVSTGKLEDVKMVLGKFPDKIDINAQTHLGFSALHIACINGCLEMVQALLKAGADVNAMTQSGHSPLHAACEHGHLDIVKELLAHGAEVNVKTLKGHTPLVQALRREYFPIATVLLDRSDIDVNVKYKGGKKFKDTFTAFDNLCHISDLGVARKLLENGAKPLQSVGFYSIRPVLNLAREQNNVEMVKDLLWGTCNAYLALKEENAVSHYIFGDKKYETISGIAASFFGAKTDNASKCAAVVALKENLENFNNPPNDLTKHLSAAESGSHVGFLYKQYAWLCEKKAAAAHTAPVLER